MTRGYAACEGLLIFPVRRVESGFLSLAARQGIQPANPPPCVNFIVRAGCGESTLVGREATPASSTTRGQGLSDNAKSTGPCKTAGRW